MENKKLRIALRLAVEHIACYSDTCYYCEPNWRSKCQCVDDYCSDDCLKLIETCLLNEADELIMKEDVQTCRMFDITMDELKKQALDKWQKLKEFIEERIKKYKDKFDDPYVFGRIDEQEDLLNKMQELEEDKD